MLTNVNESSSPDECETRISTEAEAIGNPHQFRCPKRYGSFTFATTRCEVWLSFSATVTARAKST